VSFEVFGRELLSVAVDAGAWPPLFNDRFCGSLISIEARFLERAMRNSRYMIHGDFLSRVFRYRSPRKSQRRYPGDACRERFLLTIALRSNAAGRPEHIVNVYTNMKVPAATPRRRGLGTPSAARIDCPRFARGAGELGASRTPRAWNDARITPLRNPRL
jgi:hypothetical protein